MPARIVLETPILDANNARSLIDGIRETVLSEPAGQWILDLQAVKFVDSAAMSVLVRLISELALADRIRLEGARDDLKRRWPQLFGSVKAANPPATGKGATS